MYIGMFDNSLAGICFSDILSSMSSDEQEQPDSTRSSASLDNGSPGVIDTGGRLHEFWDHSVLFVANLLALFFGNEDETRLLENEIQGADSYGGRLLPILNLLYRGGNNVLVLERAPDLAMQRYFVEQLGLTLPRIEILSHSDYLEIGDSAEELTARFGASGVAAVDGYVTDPILSAMAEMLNLSTVSSMEGSRHGNNKALLHDAMVAAGLPMFETLRAVSAEDVPRCVAYFKKQGFRSAVIKSPLGASGIGIMKAGVNEPFDVPDMMFFEGACMVQGWSEPGVRGIQSITSPSVQMFLNASQVMLYDVTDQILSDDSVHQGNESPPVSLGEHPGLREELFRQAGIAGRWLHAQGYRGTASVDFLVVQYANGGKAASAASDPGRLKSPFRFVGAHSDMTVHICEINARVTGATYPSVLARHFRPDGAWLMRNVTMNKPVTGGELLEKLDFTGHLFTAGARQGVLPINLNLGDNDTVVKGQFLSVADTVAVCHEILGQVETRLGIPWKFDRD